MAKTTFYICDLCKSYSRVKLTDSLSIKTTDRSHKMLICSKCSTNLLGSFDKEDVNDLPAQIPVTKPNSDGIVYIPPAKTTIANYSKPTCAHDRNSFEENSLVCRDCGETWSAK